MNVQMNFSQLESYIGKNVRINRGGPESQEGKLLELKQDFLTLLGQKNTIIYYQGTHIKSVTINTKEEVEVIVPIEEPVLEFESGESFKEVLDELVFSSVQVNRGGPEKVEGVLLEVNDDHIIVGKEAELVHIALFHVKSVSKVVKMTQQEESSNNQEDNQKENRGENRRENLFSNNWQPVSKK